MSDLSTFLAVWRNDTSISVLRHLANSVNFGNFVSTDPYEAAGCQENPQDKQVADWLREPQTREVLEAAFFEHANEVPEGQDTNDILSQLSDAIAKLK